MKTDGGIWDILSKVVVVLLIIAALLGVAIWYLPVIKQNERMRKENLKLETQIKQEEENARQLKAAAESLRNDPKAVERLAREKLGYAKPGETVIRFQDPATNAVSARP